MNKPQVMQTDINSPKYGQIQTPTQGTTQIDMTNNGIDVEDVNNYQVDETFNKLPWYRKMSIGVFYTLLAIASLYFFMVAVRWIGDSFTLILGCEAKDAFKFSDNPVAGLMVGIIATALLHSSGTVTSITVALVGAGGLTVRQSVPITMGANVGTCVTCIMVAFGQVGKRDQFERAMAAATVHDMYNIWSVLVMYPIELLFHPLQYMSEAMAGAKTTSGAFTSPVDFLVKPLSEALLIVDKKMIEKVATGKKSCIDARFLTGGALKNMSDDAAGGIGLAIGFILLVISLVSLVHMMSRLFRGSAQKVIRKILNFNGYVNIFLGTLVTFAVHSSTIVTSTLTPMAGLNIITLEQVYPLVIGANLGTTATALLASMVTGKSDAVAVALVHFWFNVFGIFLFYPIPITRKPILGWARSLAYYSARWPATAIMFIVLLFAIIPTILLGLTYLYKGNTVSLVFAIIISVVVVVGTAGFYYWYLRKGGRAVWYAFLEKKAEEKRAKDAEKEAAAVVAAKNEDRLSTTQ